MNYIFISNYLNYCKTHKRLSSHTIRAYKKDLYQFYYSQNKHVKYYIDSLTKTNIKTTTLKRKIATLKAFYNYLTLENLISENPFKNLRFQFRSEKTLPKTIPTEELRLIYQYLKEKTITSQTLYQKQKSDRNLLIVSLLLSTGLRISELCHMTIDRINLLNKTIHVLGKGKKERIIYLGDYTTYTLLKKYISTYHNNKNLYLFEGNKNTRPLSEQSIRLILKKVQKDINLTRPITPHMFRHSFATMLLDSNVDIRYIQHLLGHSSITVTQIYTHVSQQKQQDILTFYNPMSSILQK